MEKNTDSNGEMMNILLGLYKVSIKSDLFNITGFQYKNQNRSLFVD